jgi:hypothetical protein
MLVRAEINCLNCGRFLGELEGERGASYKNARLVSSVGTGKVVNTPAGLRCGHCGGKAIIEAIDPSRRAA